MTADMKAWERAAAEYKTLAGALKTTVSPGDRATAYSRMLRLTVTLAENIDLDLMPPLEPGDGTSYHQAYAHAAELLRLLADCERRFGGQRPAAACRPRAATPAEAALWDRYTASADRKQRAELLIELYELAARRTGYEGADPLNTAALTERAISAPAKTRT